MNDHAALIEQSLAAAADGPPLWPAIFARFFAAYPHRSLSFLNLDASGPRMTDEALAMMLGLAKGESWVEPLVAELSFTHRNYGVLPDAEYDAFVDMAIDAVEAAVGSAWTSAHRVAWEAQAARLTPMIARMRRDWSRVMPGAVSG